MEEAGHDEHGDHDDHDDDHDDGGHADEEGDHDDHDDMVCYDMNTHVDSTITTEDDCNAGLMWTAANSGPSDNHEEGHHEPGYVSIHIEEEGDYGFAVPNDVEFFVLADAPSPFEWAGIFSISDSAHTWTMEKVDGAYADPSMRVVIIPTDTPTEETMHSLEGGVEEMIEGDSCTVVEDGGTMTPISADGSCFELHVGSGDMSTFNMDTTGMTGFGHSRHTARMSSRTHSTTSRTHLATMLSTLLKSRPVVTLIMTMAIMAERAKSRQVRERRHLTTIHTAG